jgi:hypothetical protein
MSLNRSKIELTGSAEMIRKAREHFEKMPKVRRIELMVEAGVMTAEQAERAKEKLAELAEYGEDK